MSIEINYQVDVGLIRDEPLFPFLALKKLDSYRMNLAEKVHHAAVNCFKTCYNHSPEILLTFSALRLTFKTARGIYPNYGPVFTPHIGGLGLFTLQKILLTPHNILQFGHEMKVSYLCRDWEGMGFHATEIFQTVTDGFDSLITFANSLHEVHSAIPLSGFLNTAFFPAAFFSTTLDLVTQSVKYYQTSKALQKIENDYSGFVKEFKSYNVEDIDDLKKQKRKRERQLTACTSEAVCELVKSGKLDAGKEIATYLKRKLTVIRYSQATNMIGLLAVTLLFFSIVAPYVPIGLFALCTIIKLGLYIYKRRSMCSDLPSIKAIQ